MQRYRFFRNITHRNTKKRLGILAGGVVARKEHTHRVAESVLHVFLLQRKIGECQIHGDIALLVLQPGRANFLGFSHHMLEHAS